LSRSRLASICSSSNDSMGVLLTALIYDSMLPWADEIKPDIKVDKLFALTAPTDKARDGKVKAVIV
jgi:hypothetical protein